MNIFKMVLPLIIQSIQESTLLQDFLSKLSNSILKKWRQELLMVIQMAVLGLTLSLLTLLCFVNLSISFNKYLERFENSLVIGTIFYFCFTCIFAIGLFYLFKPSVQFLVDINKPEEPKEHNTNIESLILALLEGFKEGSTRTPKDLESPPLQPPLSQMPAAENWTSITKPQNQSN